MTRLLEKHPPSTTGIDPQSFATLSSHYRRSLRRTDDQLDLLRDRILRKPIARSSLADELDKDSDAARHRFDDIKSVFFF